MSCQALSAGWNASTYQAPLNTLEGGETGRIYYRSANPRHYRNLVDGLADDAPQVVFGDLVIPQGAADPTPVMIFMHGSGGWSSTHVRYLKAFHKMGVATFRTDSFTTRKVSSTVGRQGLVHRSKMMADAYHALTLLRTHPRLDPERIGLMGASKGGGVALFTAWEFWTRPSLPDPARFALHIPLYPNCSTRFEVNELSGAPVLILVGDQDDWTGWKGCVELTAELRRAGYDVETKVYAGAHHGFDSETTWDVRWSSRGFGIANCRFLIDRHGESTETNTGSYRTCRTDGVHYGRNQAATRASMQDVKAFVARVFGLSTPVR